jgi:hypothetical protein
MIPNAWIVTAPELIINQQGAQSPNAPGAPVLAVDQPVGQADTDPALAHDLAGSKGPSRPNKPGRLAFELFLSHPGDMLDLFFRFLDLKKRDDKTIAVQIVQTLKSCEITSCNFEEIAGEPCRDPQGRTRIRSASRSMAEENQINIT